MSVLWFKRHQTSIEEIHQTNRALDPLTTKVIDGKGSVFIRWWPVCLPLMCIASDTCRAIARGLFGKMSGMLDVSLNFNIFNWLLNYFRLWFEENFHWHCHNCLFQNQQKSQGIFYSNLDVALNSGPTLMAFDLLL